MSIGTSEADRSRAYIAATTESLHHSQQTLIPAVDSSPRLIAQVHFNGLKSLYSKYLVHKAWTFAVSQRLNQQSGAAKCWGAGATSVLYANHF
jgi:hypothetical protein